MFAIRRRTGESVVVCTPDGAKLRLSVIKAHGDSATLAFNAPASFAIHRAELYDRASARPDSTPLVVRSEADAECVREAAKAIAPDDS